MGVQIYSSTALRRWEERWGVALPPRKRGESWEDYLQRLEHRLPGCWSAAWGDWVESPPEARALPLGPSLGLRGPRPGGDPPAPAWLSAGASAGPQG